MIHFYTYYSVGGYKDMYLGNEQSEAERKYYLPLLPIMKRQAVEEMDAKLAAKVKHQEALAQIRILTQQENFGFPKVANTLITHGSYSLIFTHLEGEKYILVLRGIMGKDKDENGRSIPFLLSLMCDSEADLLRMTRLVGYIAMRTKTAKQEIAECLHYDPVENGLCFEQKLLRRWIDNITSGNVHDGIMLVSGHPLRISPKYGSIALMLLPRGVSKEYALGELALNKTVMNAFCENMILPADDQAEAILRRKEWAEVEKRQQRRLWSLAAVTFVSIILISSLVYMCARH